MSSALEIAGKMERQEKVSEIESSAKEAMLEKCPEMTEEQFRDAFDRLEMELVRKNVIENDRRIDGRGMDELRDLNAQVGFLPRAHGSALFSRGETQALGTLTMGTKSDIQGLDAVTGGEEEKKFMLHYNFPPYSVGEVGRVGFTGRREIGHGALAEKCLSAILPDDYPYTMRLVSDIMGSNGSSSMASVCVGTLALMDAGVPIKKPAAGISIGLFTGDQRAKLVTDILGAEDHCGDMDFKVAGTRDGITGFQVDLKIPGLNWELVEGAFEMAKKARAEILTFMESILSMPRGELAEHAPRIHEIKIDPEKIGALIGPGGKNIRRITEMSGAQIDVEPDGKVSIFATDKESMDMAVQEVELISAEAEEGVIYKGVVKGIKEFGAFVEILPGKEGLVHISELADFHVNSVEDICQIGDQMWVKCIGIDDRGRIRLSRKAAMAEKDTEETEE
jgi:polyribonucleotide nucleotidyltransferase